MDKLLVYAFERPNAGADDGMIYATYCDRVELGDTIAKAQEASPVVHVIDLSDPGQTALRIHYGLRDCDRR